ncbi:MAG: 3-methyl-2-oxobutanoate hydroxymethyltransferase [Actinobacteria bacterium]|nr:MAG: 3-methyl-2-oxobutanoate hydroxymethyltransferase [Actinomycetota bacterium]
MPVSIHDLRAYKTRVERFVMLTAYDHPTAQILDEAGIPVLLVGDSLAQVVLGYDSTIPVTMDEMLHHTRAVARGARNALIVGDMPFMSYQASVEDGLRNAGRFLKEGGAHSVKVEGPQMELASAMAERGIPVMGHLGLTPQSVHLFGGYKVQGRSDEQAQRIRIWAKELEEAGAFALVLECVPSALAAEITAALSIPTIGIGAGPACDAQVLVVHDLVGLSGGQSPKFVKRYADVRTQIADAAKAFAAEVTSGTYPDDEHSYS